MAEIPVVAEVVDLDGDTIVPERLHQPPGHLVEPHELLQPPDVSGYVVRIKKTDGLLFV